MVSRGPAATEGKTQASSSATRLSGAHRADWWINAAIAVGSAMFVFGLAFSAVLLPKWRVLHVLQALIYVAVVLLTRRKNAGGFGAGLAVAVFWNSLLMFVTTVARDGIRELGTLARTGHTQHPDLLLSLFVACGHVLIIVGCIFGFARMHRAARQWLQLLAGGVAAVVYLIAIVFVFGPPEAVALMKHVFGL